MPRIAPPLRAYFRQVRFQARWTPLVASFWTALGIFPIASTSPARGWIKIGLTGNVSDFALILRDAAGNKVDTGAMLSRPIEAGSYSLLLSGVKPGQTGDFKVTTSFTAEPGMLCSNFPNIGRHQVVAGLLPSSGCQALDGSPYEAYTLTTDGAGTLTVAVDSARLRVRRSASVPTTGAYSFCRRSAPSNVQQSDGDSQIFHRHRFERPDWRLHRQPVGFQAGSAGNLRRSQKTFTESDADANTIGASSCFVTIAGSGDQSYYNYYNLTLTIPGLVDVTAISGDFNATLNLLDPGGNVVASNSGGGGYDAQYNVQSSLRAPLPAGSYRLQVFSDFPSGGAYTLKYAFTPGNPAACTPSALNFGGVLIATLGPGSCRTSIGISDLYTLTVPNSGTVDLDMSASVFAGPDTYALRDAKWTTWIAKQ